MERIQLARRGGAIFLSALFFTCVYRAATQSLTCDEAFSWHLFISHGWTAVFHTVDANNHMLATISFGLAYHLFGGNEFALRLPTLLGCALFLVSVFRIYSRVFGRALPLLIALGVTTLNPLLLDFMVAARGYGMAVAFLTYSILALVNDLDGAERRHLWRALAGICLSIGTNLTCLTPAVMLIASFFAIVALRRGLRKALLESSLLAGPMALFATAIYFIFPLHLASRATFYVGLPGWMESFRNLIQVSFYHDGYIGDPNPIAPMIQMYLNAVAIVAGALLVWIGVRWILSVKSSEQSAIFLLTAGTLWGSMIALFLAHQLLRVPYPINRTGLYFLVLMPLAAMTIGGRWPAIPQAIAAIVVVIFAVQWNTRFFYVWRFDADDKEIMRMLEQRAGHAQTPVQVGVSWPLEVSLEYYRVKRNYEWMAPLDLNGPTAGRDYYVIAPPMTDLELDDRSALTGKRTIYQGPVSKTVVAAP